MSDTQAVQSCARKALVYLDTPEWNSDMELLAAFDKLSHDDEVLTFHKVLVSSKWTHMILQRITEIARQAHAANRARTTATASEEKRMFEKVPPVVVPHVCSGPGCTVCRFKEWT